MPSARDIALGERIANLLEERGLTQDGLGAALGIHQSGISRRLSGDIPIRAAELIAIATFLGVSLGELSGTEAVA